ncbi:MAG: hypothetical protein RR218_10605, partial [Gordonibacter sp.]
MINEVIVDGIPLCATFGLILQSCSEGEPEPKTYEVDVPGGNGSLDLTEALTGDVVFENRSFEFEFAFPDGRSVLSGMLTRLRSFFHGRRLPFELSWDGGYEYAGRFSVSSTARIAKQAGTIVVSASVDPYKLKETCTYRVNAAGGVTVSLPSGRRRVRPIIEVHRRALVSMDGQTWVLEPGASRVRDLWLTLGDNVLTIDTYPGYCVTYWTDYTGRTWGHLAGKRWSEVGAGDKPLQESPAWSDYAGQAWGNLSGKRWVEMMHPAEPGD